MLLQQAVLAAAGCCGCSVHSSLQTAGLAAAHAAPIFGAGLLLRQQAAGAADCRLLLLLLQWAAAVAGSCCCCIGQGILQNAGLVAVLAAAGCLLRTAGLAAAHIVPYSLVKASKVLSWS